MMNHKYLLTIYLQKKNNHKHKEDLLSFLLNS